MLESRRPRDAGPPQSLSDRCSDDEMACRPLHQRWLISSNNKVTSWPPCRGINGSISIRCVAASMRLCGVVIVRPSCCGRGVMPAAGYGAPAMTLAPRGQRRGRVDSADRVFLEQTGDQGGVEVGANTHDQPVLEPDDPAVAIVEAHAVLGCRQGMKLDHRLIVLDDQVFHVELRALGKNLSQLGERALDEGRLAGVVTGERMGPHDRPVHVVGHMREEGGAVAHLQSLEDLANEVFCNRHFSRSSVFWSTAPAVVTVTF